LTYRYAETQYAPYMINTCLHKARTGHIQILYCFMQEKGKGFSTGFSVLD